MPKDLLQIHKAIKPESFYMLFLSEGFLNLPNHWDAFIQHCHILTRELFKIFPYNFCKDRISVWANFVPSNEEGVGIWADPATRTTNGAFDSDTGWTKGTGWSIAAGVATKTSGTASDLEQNQTVTNTVTYQTTFTISNRTAGAIFIRLGGTAGTSRSTNGTFIEDIVAGAGGDPKLELVADASFAGDIDDVGVRPAPIRQPKDTAFKFMTNFGFLKTAAPENIIAAIRNIRIRPYGQPERPAEDVWLNCATRTRRAVCIILRSKAAGGRSFYRLDSEWENADPAITQSLLPFIAITHYPRLILGDSPLSVPPQYDNRDERCGATFAHELGHIPGLGDEYEDEASFYRYFPDEKPEPLCPNIIADQTLPYPTYVSGASYRKGARVQFNDTIYQSDLDNNLSSPPTNWSERDKPETVGSLRSADGTIDINKIKWIDLIETSRRAQFKEIEHPDKEAEEGLYRPILEDAVSSIILLKHPRDQNGIPIDPSIRYVPFEKGEEVLGGRKLLMQVEEPNLIEGGYNYWSRVYRPTPENCLMGREGYVGVKHGAKKWITFPYCRVCRKHILKTLGGVYDYKLGGVQIRAGPPTILNLRLESHIAKKFVQHIKLTEGTYSDNALLCIAATQGRYQSFFETYVKDIDLLEVTDGFSDPEWPDTSIKYPAHLEKNRLFLHWLWASVFIRQYDHSAALLRYAATGAVGTMLISGFGSLANRCETRMVQIEGEDKAIPFLLGLTDDELSNVAEGSLLQLWPTKHHYEQSVLYVAARPEGPVDPARRAVHAQTCVDKINTLANITTEAFKAKVGANGSPQVDGHSVVYMGKTGSTFWIADQKGIKRDLKTEWSRFKFYIAAQWYDANITDSG